eukprot:Gb_32926 [translate_table: standard]
MCSAIFMAKCPVHHVGGRTELASSNAMSNMVAIRCDKYTCSTFSVTNAPALRLDKEGRPYPSNLIPGGASPGGHPGGEGFDRVPGGGESLGRWRMMSLANRMAGSVSSVDLLACVVASLFGFVLVFVAGHGLWPTHVLNCKHSLGSHWLRFWRLNHLGSRSISPTTAMAIVPSG